MPGGSYAVIMGNVYFSGIQELKIVFKFFVSSLFYDEYFTLATLSKTEGCSIINILRLLMGTFQPMAAFLSLVH